MVQLDTHPPNLTHNLNISQSDLGANHMYPVQALFTLAIFSSNFSRNFVRRQVALNLNKNNSPWIGFNMLCNVFFTEEAFHEASEILKITAALQQILWRIVREERQICRSFYAMEGHVQLVLLGDTASMEAKALWNCSV